MSNRYFYRLRAYFAWCYYLLLFGAAASAFFWAIRDHLIAGQLGDAAALCASVLAVHFGFAALLYSRSRALRPGKPQRRSLYAAERLMQAITLFILGVALGSMGTALLRLAAKLEAAWMTSALSAASIVLFTASTILVLMAFGSSMMTVQTLSHQLVRWIPTRLLAKRLRRI